MKQAVVLLADGFEEVEALTVVDLLRRARVYVDTISITEDYTVRGAHGIPVLTEDLFTEVNFDEMDMVVLPGGMPGTTNLLEHAGGREVVTKFVQENKPVAAICAAPMILSELGLVKGKMITCYPSIEPNIKGAVITRTPVAADGNLITSRGVGCAIDFALKLIEILVGKEMAAKIAEDIVYE